MSAVIRSTVHVTPAGPVVGPVLTGQSRNDLQKGNQVVLESVDDHTTYSWTLAFKPTSTGGGTDPLDGVQSSAVLLPPEGTTSKTAKFNVDYVGAYLVRLTVDSGLPTESTQFLRFRYLTRFGDATLVAAGERRDETGVIPADVDPEGWANDQNRNLQRTLGLVRRLSTTGRSLYVDANRGRDNTAAPNDSTNLVDFPGSDPADPVTTGMKTKAVAFGDFDTINGAIAYAQTAVARGEPAPSSTNPYFIYVQPGLYEEDLNLQPHIHIIGLGTTPVSDDIFRFDGTYALVGLGLPVVRAANVAGGTHRFSPTGTPEDDAVHLENIILENTSNTTTQPTLLSEGGLLSLDRVLVFQKGTSATQGPALGVISADPSVRAACFARRSIFRSLCDTAADRYAVVFDAPKGYLQFWDCRVRGEASGLAANPSLYQGSATTGNIVDLRYTTIEGQAGYGVRSYAWTFSCHSSIINGVPDTNALVFDAFGAAPGSMVGNVFNRVLFTDIQGDMTLDVAGATGNVILDTGGTSWETLNYPNGNPFLENHAVESRSLHYNPQFPDPTTGIPAVPATSQLPTNDVQGAIDTLVLSLFPLGVAPFYSLETAYNGVAALTFPPTIGDGLGRRITADGGSVQIVSQLAPVGPPVGLLTPNMNGWLQVESGVDIGALVNDGTGSEISLRPNPYGAGPSMELGHAVWPDDGGAVARGITSATVIAGQTENPTAPTDGAYNLRLRTKSAAVSGTGELGRLILEGGNSLNLGASPPKPGQLFLQAGDDRNITGPGDLAHVWISPGTSVPLADDGWLYLVKPSDSTQTVLIPANAFVGGVTGEIYFATINGFVAISVDAADNLAAVAAKVTATGELVGSSVGGKLHITTVATGPNSDVLFVADDQSGALNTALGDYTLTGGAARTAGTFPSTVGLRCSADSTLEVNGTIVATGVGGMFVHNTVTVNSNGNVRYVVVPSITYVGVDTTVVPTGIVTVELPNTTVAGAIDGRQIIIKDQGGGLANPAQHLEIEVGPAGPPAGRIDGTTHGSATPLVLNIPYQSITVVCRGINGGVADWYLV